ncbi:hypothetical protein L1047_13250 [Synechococcus sp. Nb3U1]|nr:hypothetical protein [Synechococcus sp. Nb3U1]
MRDQQIYLGGVARSGSQMNFVYPFIYPLSIHADGGTPVPYGSQQKKYTCWLS